MLCIFRLLIFGKTKNKHTNGGVAQLGEHLPCKQGVMGSNPIISTRSAHADKQSQFASQIEDRVWEKDGNWKHTWEMGL